MRAEHVDAVVERQRPFKIFIALLDKWDIGGPVTEALAQDSFRALKGVLDPNDTQDEVCPRLITSRNSRQRHLKRCHWI